MSAAAPPSDAVFMRQAIAEARGGWGQVAPNPLVGAVVVQRGEVVGVGHHARYGGAHAEVVALQQAGAAARNATLYVTLEPCAHVGKTPPCTTAILEAGIARVVYAVTDPNPVAAGGGQVLRSHGVSVASGVCEGEARELNAAFFHRFVSSRPFVTLKLAVSLDAAIAHRRHTTTRITGVEAQRYAHALRAGHDAVGVGMGTVHTDDPQLTVRLAPSPRVAPARVVFSHLGALSPSSNLAASTELAPVYLTCEPSAAIDPRLAGAGVRVIRAADIGSALEQLAQAGIHSLLVEGGTRLAAAFLASAVVDRLTLIQAPVIFGADSLGAFSAVPDRPLVEALRWRPVERVELGDDLATTYALAT